MVKTAPAPAKKSGGGGLTAAGVIVLLLAGVWFAADRGWIGDNPPGEEEQTEQERVRVTWQLWWGYIPETGEVYEDTGKPKSSLECDERDLTITSFVDGEPTVHDQYESDAEVTERCTWRWHQAVPQGSELRLLVEEGSPGGTPIDERWKMCQIDVDGHMALPNGWAIAPQGSDCEVWAVAL